MIKTALLAAAALLGVSIAQAQTVREADLRRHIEILASDAFEGRRPATAGGDRTEAYLVDAFARAGLQPGTSDGRWRQTVRIMERKPVRSKASWWGPSGAIPVAEDQLVVVGGEPNVRLGKSQLMFVGYGLPENLDGVDLRDKVVLHLSGAPQGRTGVPRMEERRAAMLKGGAAAAIAIAPEGAPWQQVRSGAQLARSLEVAGERPLAAQGMISAEAASSLLKAAGSDLAQLTAQAAAVGFRPRPLNVQAEFDVETGVKRIESSNIVGKISGNIRADEAVVLLAHWDHLGICRPEGAADRICNGAVDNASGIAILIEVARHLAAGPKPGRTIYILATTAEEGGLMGAEAFASAPPVPKDSIVAALNIDTTAIGPAGLPVAIIGRGNHPALEAVIDETVRKLGRKVDPDTEANVMITRQDGWAFGARGIPAMMVTGSVSDMNRLRTYLGGGYHGPTDDIANMKELGGAAEDATLHIGVARALADPARYERQPR
jgi:hypothetical protein